MFRFFLFLVLRLLSGGGSSTQRRQPHVSDPWDRKNSSCFKRAKAESRRRNGEWNGRRNGRRNGYFRIALRRYHRFGITDVEVLCFEKRGRVSHVLKVSSERNSTQKKIRRSHPYSTDRSPRPSTRRSTCATRPWAVIAGDSSCVPETVNIPSNIEL